MKSPRFSVRPIDKDRKPVDKKKRVERREQQAREVEASQAALRKSIAETQRCVDDSDAMLRRHRKECEDDDRS